MLSIIYYYTKGNQLPFGNQILFLMEAHIESTQAEPALAQLTENPAKCAERLSAVGDALYVIGGKWKLRIIIAICDGHLRFNELQRVIDGITSKVLSSELKDLELNGLVKRTVIDDKPVVVKYEPTAYTHTLKDVLQSLAAWGFNHREKLRAEG